LPGKSRKHNQSQATWLIHSCEEVNCNITIKYDEQGQFVTNNLARACQSDWHDLTNLCTPGYYMLNCYLFRCFTGTIIYLCL